MKPFPRLPPTPPPATLHEVLVHYVGCEPEEFVQVYDPDMLFMTVDLGLIMRAMGGPWAAAAERVVKHKAEVVAGRAERESKRVNGPCPVCNGTGLALYSFGRYIPGKGEACPRGCDIPIEGVDTASGRLASAQVVTEAKIEAVCADIAARNEPPAYCPCVQTLGPKDPRWLKAMQDLNKVGHGETHDMFADPNCTACHGEGTVK